MQDITLKQLEIFNAVVVAGSITKASRRIDLSQPSISQQLAKLEERLETQLVVRKRGGAVVLTPAGEYWFGVASELLGRLRAVLTEHDQRFISNRLTLRLGVTPNLRGRLIAAAARIASSKPGFIKFEVTYASSSADLVEMLRLHQINCAIVTDESIVDDRQSFMVSPLFDDPLVWLVPAAVSPAEINQALRDHTLALPPALSHFVEVETNLSARNSTLDWYRHALPLAAPTYAVNTYSVAVDLVAANLASTHSPLSLLPNLDSGLRKLIRLVPIDVLTQPMVLAMPRHLFTLRAYAQTYNEIAEFCRTDYVSEMRRFAAESHAAAGPRGR